MSLETWKAEFYPTPAEDTAKEDAIAHSLRKWQGLTPENLKKHGVIHEPFAGVIDESDFSAGKPIYMYSEAVPIDSGTCALCHHHYNSGDEESWEDDDFDEEDSCGVCPLKEARGGVSCDCTRDDEQTSPWNSFSHPGNTGSNPKPMIFWLQKALDDQQKGEGA